MNWLIPNYYYPKKIGTVVDSLDGVVVYYNGPVAHVCGRNKTKDGYNLGLKYQCVEFVKRYYYEHYKHKMADAYGHAKDFFDPNLSDSAVNVRRNLIQFKNGGKSKPQKGDLLVYSGTEGNPYGHVSIVAQVLINEIEIVQQNPGMRGNSRERFAVNKNRIENNRILGWLRKP